MSASSFDVSGKAVLITGAGAGIGRALAGLVHDRGARVALLDRDGTAAQRAATELGKGAVALTADVRDAAATADAVERAADALGGLDVVVANAGISLPPTPMAALDSDLFERIVDVDLLGVWRTVRPAIPYLQRSGGQFVLQASVYSWFNGAFVAPYAAAKAGVEQLARALRVELAPWGVTTLSSHFSFVQTDLVRAQETAVLTELERGSPAFLRKRLTPEQAAGAMLRGIERRAARVAEPRWTRVLFRGQGVLNPMLDARAIGDTRIRALLRQESPSV